MSRRGPQGQTYQRNASQCPAYNSTVPPARSGFSFGLDRSDPTPACVQLERQVRTAVADGTLAPGERLPSVRRAAHDLALSTSTVARAYAALVREGVLASRPGGGSAVASRERLDQPALVRQRRERIRALARQITVRALALGVGPAEAIAAVEREFAERGQPRTAQHTEQLPSSMEAELLSARNQLQGVVSAIRCGEVIAEITFELHPKSEAVAVVTVQSLRRLGLRVGTPLFAHVKATEITLGR